MEKLQKMFLGIGIGLLVLIPIWMFLVVPEFEKIPDDFSLKSELLSVENFFDPERNTFKGEIISKSLLEFTVDSVQGDILLIDTIFDVKTISGEPIFIVKRKFGVDAKTGKNVAGYGDKDREGYFLFPKHAEKKSYRFTYFTSDEISDLEFVGEENILGLMIYHYRTSFTKDSSDILSWEEGVPEKRRILNEITIDIWVEPVSGSFVKFKDSGQAFYHDADTGQKLFFRNKYQNEFTDDATTRQVRIAQNKKQQIILYEIIIPILLAIIAIALLIASYLGGFLKNMGIKEDKK